MKRRKWTRCYLKPEHGSTKQENYSWKRRWQPLDSSKIRDRIMLLQDRKSRTFNLVSSIISSYIYSVQPTICFENCSLNLSEFWTQLRSQHITQNFPLLAPNEYGREKEKEKEKTKQREDLKFSSFEEKTWLRREKFCVKKNRWYAHS